MHHTQDGHRRDGAVSPKQPTFVRQGTTAGHHRRLAALYSATRPEERGNSGWERGGRINCLGRRVDCINGGGGETRPPPSPPRKDGKGGAEGGESGWRTQSTSLPAALLIRDHFAPLRGFVLLFSSGLATSWTNGRRRMGHTPSASATHGAVRGAPRRLGRTR